jgi:hypothetical protein
MPHTATSENLIARTAPNRAVAHFAWIDRAVAVLTTDRRTVTIVATACGFPAAIDTAGSFDRRGAPERDSDGLGVIVFFSTGSCHDFSLS